MFLPRRVHSTPSFQAVPGRVFRARVNRVLDERAPHIVLARPVQPAELVKCVRAVLRKERGKRCLGVDIARWLGMDPRSLERHLSSEGTTFREISRQVQLQASQRLLKQGASVSDVAEALGFSEISAFTRAFRRWSGETPSSWKLRHQRAERPRDARALWQSTRRPSASGRRRS